jgi:hypothetical protein
MLKAEKYMPYASSRFVFDKTHTDAALSGSGITTPHAKSYFETLLAFQARTLRLQ